MGIPKFYSTWLRRRNYRDVIQRRHPSEVCSLSVDMNGIIHNAAGIVYAYGKASPQSRGDQWAASTMTLTEQDINRRAGFLRNMAETKLKESTSSFNLWLTELENEHFRTITQMLTNIIADARPSDILVLAIDGPPPAAKLKQQRSRRFKSAKERADKTRREIAQVQSIKLKRGQKKPIVVPWPLFDSNAITPGTEFMMRLDTYLRGWLDELKVDMTPHVGTAGRNKPYVLPATIYYFSHLTPGEGEHKIMDLMRAGDMDECSTGEGSHIIYGADADLIMLGLISPLNKLYIARDSFTDVIAIDNLRQAVMEELRTSSALEDFVVMMFLLGNDFLPHPPAMEQINNAISVLFRIYRKINSITEKDPEEPLIETPKIGPYPLTKGSAINWDGIKMLLFMLGEVEPQMIEHIANNPPAYPFSAVQQATTTIKTAPVVGPKGVGTGEVTRSLDFDLFRNLWYRHALLPRTSWANMSEKDKALLASAAGLPAVEEPQVDTNIIIDMITKYLEGIGWVYTYYTGGMSSINLDWFYPYNYSPLFVDMSSIIRQDVNLHDYTYQAGQQPLGPIYQLLSVLPPQSGYLAVPGTQWLMELGSPIADLYPLDFPIELEGKSAEWQGWAVLPSFQPHRVVKAVNENINISPEIAEKYNAPSALK